MKVKIIEVGQDDAYYGLREECVGNSGYFENPTLKDYGWHSGWFTPTRPILGDCDPVFFRHVKFVAIEES